MKVELLLGGLPAIAVLDTGASNSFISERFSEQLGGIVSGDGPQVHAIGNDKFKALGLSRCSVSVSGICMLDNDFLILPNKVPFNFDVLLGMDFIKNNKLEICVKDSKLVKHFNNSSLEIYLTKSGKSECNMARNIKCYAAEDAHVPQGQL